jgi:hypothetical protein
VRALPLAASINKGGHYFRHFSSSSLLLFLLVLLFKIPEGVVIGFQIFTWAPKKIVDPPAPSLGPLGAIFMFFLGSFQIL